MLVAHRAHTAVHASVPNHILGSMGRTQQGQECSLLAKIPGFCCQPDLIPPGTASPSAQRCPPSISPHHQAWPRWAQAQPSCFAQSLSFLWPGGAQTPSTLFQPPLKSVLLQHLVLQPALDSQCPGCCSRKGNAALRLHVAMPRVGDEGLQMIREAQAGVTNSHLACGEPVKWARFVLQRHQGAAGGLQ